MMLRRVLWKHETLLVGPQKEDGRIGEEGGAQGSKRPSLRGRCATVKRYCKQLDERGTLERNTPDEWFTLAELGAWLKVSRTTAYRLIRDGQIPVYRIGRTTRIRRRDVERWLEEGRRSR